MSGDWFTLRWSEPGVVMLDQRLLPEREEYLVCASARGGRARDRDAGRARRAGDRLRGGLRRGARRLRERARATSAALAADVAGRDAAPRAHAAHGREPVLGARAHARAARARRARRRRRAETLRAALLREAAGGARRGHRRVPRARPRRRRAGAGRRAHPHPLQRRARSPPAATAPRSASCAPRSRRADASRCWPTRRGRSSRARGSPPGSWRATASPWRW